MLAKAVEQVHADSGVARGEVWANMRGMARQLKSTRDLWNVDAS